MLASVSAFVRQQWFGFTVLGLVVVASASGATGDFLKLGASNDSARTTTLTNTANGPALRLKVKPNQPPFAVNSTKRVNGLNASLLAGKPAGAFAPASGSAVYARLGTIPLVTISAGDVAVNNTSVRFLPTTYFSAPADGTLLVRAWGLCDRAPDAVGELVAELPAGGTSIPVSEAGLCEANATLHMVKGDHTRYAASLGATSGTVSLRYAMAHAEFVPD